MRQPRHTPGPWAIEAGFLEAQGHAPLFQLFGTCDCGEPIGQITGTQEEAEANARLISKAPEMAHMLKRVEAYLIRGNESHFGLLDEIHYLVAAATGDA